MIHCSLAHSGSWAGLAGLLGGDLTMTAFDIPGHGRSAGWDERGEIQAVTTDIAADFLDGSADIVGHSFGATVALRLAIERPELVRSLVLIEPVFFAVAWQDHPDMLKRYETKEKAFLDAMAMSDHHVAAREFTRLWGDGTPWESLPPAHQQLLASQMPLIDAAAQALHNDVGGLLDRGRMERLEVPVLLVEGSASPDVIHAINDGLAMRLRGAVRSVVSGAQHMVPITHPKQVAAEMLQFLRGS